jgi:hypothetical protein
MCSLKQPFVEIFSHAILPMYELRKNQVIQIFCISGWLLVPINPDMWGSAVLLFAYFLLYPQPETEGKVHNDNKALQYGIWKMRLYVVPANLYFIFRSILLSAI